MKITRTTLLFSIALITWISTSGQERFERLYRSNDWENTGLDIVQTSDKGYLVLSAGKHPDSVEYSHMNVTKLKPKGDLDWHKNYDFDENLIPAGQLTLLPNDSFAFTALFKKPEMNKVVTVADAGGNIAWSKAYGQGQSGGPLVAAGSVDLLFLDDGGFALFDEAFTGTNETDLYMARLDTAGNLLWTKSFNAPIPIGSMGEEIFDAQSTPHDNGFILAGMAENGNEMPLLVKLDSLGAVAWGKRYSFEVPGALASLARTVKPTPDTGYVAGGNAIVNIPGINSVGWVMKTDSIGNLSWAYILGNPDSTAAGNTSVKDIIPQPDSSVIVLGELNNPLSLIHSSFILKLQPDGAIDWQWSYYKNDDNALAVNQLITTQEGGFAAFGAVTEATGAMGEDVDIPYFLKIDANGASSCEDTVTIAPVIPDITIDSLFFVSQSIDTALVLDPEAENYTQYNVPVLSLDAPSFCEGEPILHTFDATVNGAVSYEWNTGDTTAMITVTQEGMYTVKVRVEEDICFDLCDTTVINIIEPPTAEIVPELGPYCSNGFIILIANGAGTYEWSTGETAPAIQVADLGTYSVTITNQCGSDAASISITQFPTAPEVSLSASTTGYCVTGAAGVALTGAEGAFSVAWSTGEINVSAINVSDLPATVSVTADWQFCGSQTTEITLEPPVLSANILVIDSFCNAGFVTLIADVRETNAFEWSTGETTDTLTITETGTYTLTALSEFCDEASDEYIRDICISEFDCVDVPNAFTPDGDAINDFFGPVIPPECADIQIVEMKIFSRWGELVFETTSPNGQWNGNFDGKPAASDVYAWWIRLENGGEERILLKGDLTLLR